MAFPGVDRGIGAKASAAKALSQATRRFLGDKRGNFALLTVISIVPIMGALALGVDYAEMSRQRQVTLNALDASGIATARRIIEGVSDDDAKAYAKSFFEANLGSVAPSMTTLTVLLPQNNTGGGTLKLTAGLKYKPFFFQAFASLMGNSSGANNVNFQATSEIRLKNTLEVALVLDNSGSMDFVGGGGSGKKRIELLKTAAKQLVDTIAGQAALMKQISKPVQFALVPFSGSVNIGPNNATASWMDQDGLSPIHHENFNWTTFTASNKKVVKAAAGFYYKQGTGWGAEENQKVTRFTLYSRDIQRRTNTSNPATYGPYASWAGCVEARPSPYNNNDATPTTATPATLYVPMFGPDEPGDIWSTSPTTNKDNYNAYNNWWNDLTEDTSGSYGQIRQKYMPKYFIQAPQSVAAATGDDGPNASCTNTAITPLTDVSDTAGQTAIKASIDAMSPNGATNVPEGMAWGWRVLSHGVPFTEGRPEIEKGNDKVVIVLTDGENTYYTPSSLGSNDPAANKSIYSAEGYAGQWDPIYYATSRIFQGTPAGISKTDYSNANYTKAMNAQFDTLCANAKAANVLVMTVSLDLNAADTTEKAQMVALKACSSDSRFRKDTAGVAEKLYWNANGGDLAAAFIAIANELSNLRIVG